MEQIITGAVLALSFWLLGVEARKETAPIIDGEVVVTYSKGFKIIGIVGLVFSALLAVMPWFVKEQSVDIYYLAIGTALVFTIMGGYLIMEVNNYYIKILPEGIECQSTFKKITKIYWKDIIKVEFNENNGYLVLKSQTEKIASCTMMIGFEALVLEMKEKVNPTAYNHVIKKIEEQLAEPEE